MDSSPGCAIVGVKKGELDTDTGTDTEGARLEETEVFQSREHRDYWSAAIELHRMEPLDRNLTGDKQLVGCFGNHRGAAHKARSRCSCSHPRRILIAQLNEPGCRLPKWSGEHSGRMAELADC